MSEWSKIFNELNIDQQKKVVLMLRDKIEYGHFIGMLARLKRGKKLTENQVEYLERVRM